MKAATMRTLTLSVLAVGGAVFLWQLANRWSDGRHSLFDKRTCGELWTEGWRI